MAGNQLMRQLKSPHRQWNCNVRSAPYPFPTQFGKCRRSQSDAVPAANGPSQVLVMKTARLHLTEPQDGKLDWPISEAGRFGCAVEVEVEMISRKFGQVVRKNTGCLLTFRDGFGGRMVLWSLHSRWQQGAPFLVDMVQRSSACRDLRQGTPHPGLGGVGPIAPCEGAWGGDWGREAESLKGQLAGRFPHPTSPIAHPTGGRARLPPNLTTPRANHHPRRRSSSTPSGLKQRAFMPSLPLINLAENSRCLVFRPRRRLRSRVADVRWTAHVETPSRLQAQRETAS